MPERRRGSKPGPGVSGGAARDADRAGPPAVVAIVGDLILLAVCGWFLWTDVAEARAGEVGMQPRTWAFMLNLTCVFVLVHRGIALLQRLVPTAEVRRRVGIVKWLAALALPFVAATAIERQVHQVHKARLDALALEIARRVQVSMDAQGTVTADALSSVRSPYLRSVAVQRDSGTFVITADVPAIGADAYRARYSSQAPGWRLEAADDSGTASASPEGSGPLLNCTPAGDILRCR